MSNPTKKSPTVSERMNKLDGNLRNFVPQITKITITLLIIAAMPKTTLTATNRVLVVPTRFAVHEELEVTSIETEIHL